MTVQEAIETLERTIIYGNPVIIEATKLGIEALKLNKTMRDTYAHPELLILPGETQKGAKQ